MKIAASVTDKADEALPGVVGCTVVESVAGRWDHKGVIHCARQTLPLIRANTNWDCSSVTG